MKYTRHQQFVQALRAPVLNFERPRCVTPPFRNRSVNPGNIRQEISAADAEAKAKLQAELDAKFAELFGSSNNDN